ncbi:MAG: glycosyltransferase family 39 protein [Planctomycetota bacterium]
MQNPDTLTSENARCNQPWFFGIAFGLLTAAYLSTALISIADLPLLDPDEPRYAGAGRAMAEGGSWLVPEFNGAPRINKPPLYYWLVAVSDKIAGGATETSSRMPSVVMGLFMLWGTIWLGRKVFGAATGLLAGLVLASTPLFFALSRCCITDMTLSTFMVGALACLMLGMTGVAPPKKSSWIAAVLFGLAVLTKATAAFAVVLVVVLQRAMSLPKESRPVAAKWLPWMLALALLFSAAALQCGVKAKAFEISKNAKAAATADEVSDDATLTNVWAKADGALNKAALVLVLGSVGILIVMAFRSERLAPALPSMWKWGLLLSIAMGLWWYVMLIGVQGWTQFKNLIDFEIKQRVAGAVHREAMHYYLLLIPAVFFPWSIGLAGSFGTALSTSDGTPPLEHKVNRFLVAWVLGIAFFFSIPGAKLPTYVLAAMPAAALLTARFLIKLNTSIRSVDVRWIRVTMALAGIVAVGLLVAPLVVQYQAKRMSNMVSSALQPAPTSNAINFPPMTLWVAAIAGAILLCGSWFVALRGKGHWGGVIIGCTTLGFILVASPQIIDGMKHRSTKQLSAAISAAVKDSNSIKTFGVADEGLSYYLRRPVTELRWKKPAPGSSGVDKLNELVGDEAAVAMIIEKRFVSRIFGKGVELSEASVKKVLPANFDFAYADENVLVLRRRAK